MTRLSRDCPHFVVVLQEVIEDVRTVLRIKCDIAIDGGERPVAQFAFDLGHKVLHVFHQCIEVVVRVPELLETFVMFGEDVLVRTGSRVAIDALALGFRELVGLVGRFLSNPGRLCGGLRREVGMLRFDQ